MAELSTLGAVIKTAYEGEADTNAFDDAAVTKLTGIEALADVTDATNVAAAGAVMDADIGVSVQAHDAVLDATTASFLTADETKLDGIEALADVTDATNVAAAGAVMTTGSELVSAQANNDLSTNPKFWLGSQAEYDGLTPTAGEIYFILAE